MVHNFAVSPSSPVSRDECEVVYQRLLNSERTLVMGVLNITEDSFSDGGLYLDAAKAFTHIAEMIEDGVDIIDIGAESTRPGAVRVPEDVERERVLMAVRAIRRHYPDMAISVDTTRSSVAQAALDEGAHIINDVSGGQLDPRMPHVVSQYGCLYIVQHWRAWLGNGTTSSSSDSTLADRDTSVYEHGVVEDTLRELTAQIAAVLAAGVSPSRIIIDPGLGFSKPAIEHNLPLIARFEALKQLGYRVLVGASRKRFVASMVERAQLDKDLMYDRDAMTQALTVLVAERGAWGVRVHEVRANRSAVQTVYELQQFSAVCGGLHELESEER